MSDEESFVILGTSPTPSMDTINSLPMKENVVTKEVTPSLNGVKISGNGFIDSQLTNSSTSNGSQYSIIANGQPQSVQLTNGTHEVDGGLVADCTLTAAELKSASSEPLNSVWQKSLVANNVQTQKENVTPVTNGIEKPAASVSNSIKPTGPEPSLAASFILGEVNSDVLKSSVYSQFPSICSMGACAEDVLKLQNMMSEYLELKKTLVNTNVTMKQLYDQTQKWKSDVKAMEDERRAEIAKLRNENLELRRDIETKVEQININGEARRKEHEEFIQSLSEKTAQIENMSAQIQKLEQQQLASFEFIPKTDMEQTLQPNEPEQEYVTTLEHNRVVKNIERQMSAIVAENMELKNMQSVYIDEINGLKLNLAAAEELQKKAQADIDFLKASDTEKSDSFTLFENERKSLRDDIEVLRQQVEIYSRDFKCEQELKENLANEKDQLLNDLRELQRKNQDLIQETQKNYEERSKQMAATGAFPKTRTQASSCSSPKPINPIYTPTNYNCPICGKIFKTLGVLQTHVNQCLDGM